MLLATADTGDPFRSLLGDLPTSVGLAAVVVVGAVLYVMARYGVLRLVASAARRTTSEWDDRFLRHRAPNRLALVPPALVVHYGIAAVAGVPEPIDTTVQRSAMAVVIVSVVWAVFGSLDAVNDLYEEHQYSAARPIKGYLQLVKLLLAIIAVVLVIAVLAEQSPVLLLSGLGAATAVLLLIFRDTILSLVASVQLATNDMIQLGDWITVDAMGVDGTVTDVALHTITVRNFDETLAFVPTHRLINEPFQNWRGMIEAGGRRFQRAVHVDVRTIGPVDADVRARWAAHPLVGDAAAEATTNLALFRVYMEAWARNHDGLYSDGRFPLLVRLLDATPSGLPVEVYAFTTMTAWNEHERIRAEVTEHLHAILPDFGLRAYQYPAGDDLMAGLTPSP